MLVTHPGLGPRDFIFCQASAINKPEDETTRKDLFAGLPTGRSMRVWSEIGPGCALASGSTWLCIERGN